MCGSQEAEATFTELNYLFISTHILMHPDPSRRVVVEVDASKTGVGAVPSLRDAADRELHACAYFAWWLSPAERNYDVGNWELLAVKLALEEWRH